MLVRLTAFILALLLSTVAYSQFKKGDRIVGVSIGNVFFNHISSDITVTSIGTSHGKSNHFGAAINPQFGWFISEKTAVGVSLNVAPSSETTTYEENGNTFQKDKVSSFDIGAGGFARTYLDKDGKFLPFVQAGLNAGISSQETSGFFYGGSGTSAYKLTYSGKSSGGFFTNASLLLGVTRKLGDNVGLEFFVGYRYSYTKGTFDRTTLVDFQMDGSIEETRNNETISKYNNHGIVLGVGFQVFLVKQSK